MFVLIVIGAVVLAVASVVVPVLIGRGVGKTQDLPDAPVAPVNPNLATCREFCREWDSRRTELCMAEADERTARSRADTLRAEFGIALMVVGGFLAAAVAAAVLPWPTNLAVAIVALAAATIASTVAAFIGGLLNHADEEVARKVTASQDARNRVGAARGHVDDHCTVEEANACLNRAAPCS